MKVCEIFTSIQGESTYAGLPCTFIRFTGCNLRCTYCDTRYAYDEGRERSVADIMDEVRAKGVGLVELTGGEPLLQPGVIGLAESLVKEGYKVLIETNGSMSLKGLPEGAVAIMDIKTPGSGMHERMDLGNLALLRPGDEVKFVLMGREDYLWAIRFVREHDLTSRCTVLFAPAFGALEPRLLAGWILEEGMDVRLNLQLHKYIFGPEERGV